MMVASSEKYCRKNILGPLLSLSRVTIATVDSLNRGRSQGYRTQRMAIMIFLLYSKLPPEIYSRGFIDSRFRTRGVPLSPQRPQPLRHSSHTKGDALRMPCMEEISLRKPIGTRAGTAMVAIAVEWNGIAASGRSPGEIGSPSRVVSSRQSVNHHQVII